MKKETYEQEVVPYLKKLGFKSFKVGNGETVEQNKTIKIFGKNGNVTIDNNLIYISINSQIILEKKTNFKSLHETILFLHELPLSWSKLKKVSKVTYQKIR